MVKTRRAVASGNIVSAIFARVSSIVAVLLAPMHYRGFEVPIYPFLLTVIQ